MLGIGRFGRHRRVVSGCRVDTAQLDSRPSSRIVGTAGRYRGRGALVIKQFAHPQSPRPSDGATDAHHEHAHGHMRRRINKR